METFFFFLVLLIPASASPTLEEGYAISTVLDANKLASPLHPFSLLPSPSASHAFLLDSAASVFYTAPLPLSQGGGVRFLAGKGGAGYSDGDGPKAMFGHPRSFAVDLGGNVYVADRSNHVIRKIAPSGVTTTIAGGYQRKTGKVDGPAQNATFSDDFELTFIPKMCVLLITDRGNSLVRQMKLKQDDCRQESSSGLGTASASLVAVASVLFGCVIGFVSSPYIRSRTGNTQRSQNHPDMEALPYQHGDNTNESLLRHQKRNC